MREREEREGGMEKLDKTIQIILASVVVIFFSIPAAQNDHTPSSSATSTTPAAVTLAATAHANDHTSPSPLPGQVIMMECPPHTLMCNEKEGEPYVISITLMYAQETPYHPQAGLYGGVNNKGGVVVGGASSSSSSRGVVKKNVAQAVKKTGNEKSLQELLEEQDIGECRGWLGGSKNFMWLDLGFSSVLQSLKHASVQNFAEAKVIFRSVSTIFLIEKFSCTL